MRRDLLSICLLTIAMLSAVCFGAPPRMARKIPLRQSAASLSESVRVGSLPLHQCLGGHAYCGSIERALDPTGQVSGNIKISFEFYPHTDGSQSPLEPIVATEGGPGYATTGSAGGYLALFAPLRDRRDMLFVDNRGTGKSQALNCPLLQSEPNPRPSGIHVCGTQLGDTAYLYDSGLAADDLAAVLDALNIPIINLYGDSYGTWLARLLPDAIPNACDQSCSTVLIPCADSHRGIPRLRPPRASPLMPRASAPLLAAVFPEILCTASNCCSRRSARIRSADMLTMATEFCATPSPTPPLSLI